MSTQKDYNAKLESRRVKFSSVAELLISHVIYIFVNARSGMTINCLIKLE